MINSSLQFKQLRTAFEALVGLAPNEWKQVKRLFSLIRIEKRQYFAKADTYPQEIGFVSSGILRAFYRTPDGVEYNKTFFLENTFVAPLTSLVTKEINQINLQALLDSEMLVADYQAFTELYDSIPPVERFARKAIEVEWCRKEIREIRLVLNSARERYEHFLSEYPGIENLIPQYHIASFLGITPVALSRIRSKRIEK